MAFAIIMWYKSLFQIAEFDPPFRVVALVGMGLFFKYGFSGYDIHARSIKSAKSEPEKGATPTGSQTPAQV